MDIKVNHVSADVQLETCDGLHVSVTLTVEDARGNAHVAISELMDGITEYVSSQDAFGEAVQGFEDIDVELEDEDIDEGAADYEWPATDFEDDGFAFSPDFDTVADTVSDSEKLDTGRSEEWNRCILCGEIH